MKFVYDKTHSTTYASIECGQCGRAIDGGPLMHHDRCPAEKITLEDDTAIYRFGPKEVAWVKQKHKSYMGGPLTLEILQNQFPNLIDSE